MKNIKIKIFAIIIILVLTGSAFWFFLSRDTEIFKLSELFGGRADESASDERNNRRDISELTEIYTNTKHGFSFSHPKELNVSEFAEEGADVVLAGDVFQILISPFDEPFDSAQGKPGPITKERILKDIPDMAVSDDKIISVGGFDGLTASGVSALGFKSKNESGETLEIWFVHNGYLYQITSLPDFEKEMLKILETWRFGD